MNKVLVIVLLALVLAGTGSAGYLFTYKDRITETQLKSVLLERLNLAKVKYGVYKKAMEMMRDDSFQVEPKNLENLGEAFRIEEALFLMKKGSKNAEAYEKLLAELDEIEIALSINQMKFKTLSALKDEGVAWKPLLTYLKLEVFER